MKSAPICITVLPDPQFKPTDIQSKQNNEILGLLDKGFFISLDPSPRVSKAFSWIKQSLPEKTNVSEDGICHLHTLLKTAHGPIGQYRSNETESSSTAVYNKDLCYNPPLSSDLPAIMAKFVERYSFANGKYNDLQAICEMHLVFELIHPFADGNGRMGRLLCAWQMLRGCYAPLAPYLERLWGGSNQTHAAAFYNEELIDYKRLLRPSEEVNKFFSNFYSHLLKDLIQALREPTYFLKVTSKEV